MSNKWMVTRPLRCGCTVAMGKVIEVVKISDFATEWRSHMGEVMVGKINCRCFRCYAKIEMSAKEPMFIDSNGAAFFAYPFTPLGGDESEIRTELLGALIEDMRKNFRNMIEQQIGRERWNL